MAELTTTIDSLLAKLKEHEDAAASIRGEIRDARKRLVIGRRAPATRRAASGSSKRARRGMPSAPNGGTGEPVTPL